MTPDMTREEAIAYGKSVIKAGLYAESRAFWKIAVKSLEQESCDDAISRQAVLDSLDRCKYSKEFCEEHHIDWSINLGMAHIVVNELKPVAPQPKMRKCKWIKYDHRTICPKEHDADDPYWMIPESRKDALKYCPYCGLEITIEE